MEINENNIDFNNVDDMIRSPDYQLVLKIIRDQREISFKKNYKQSSEPEERKFNRIFAEDDEDIDNEPKKETKKEKKKKKRKNSGDEKPKKKNKKKKSE